MIKKKEKRATLREKKKLLPKESINLAPARMTHAIWHLEDVGGEVWKRSAERGGGRGRCRRGEGRLGEGGVQEGRG